jgi:hypothetical protein
MRDSLCAVLRLEFEEVAAEWVEGVVSNQPQLAGFLEDLEVFIKVRLEGKFVELGLLMGQVELGRDEPVEVVVVLFLPTPPCALLVAHDESGLFGWEVEHAGVIVNGYG